MFLEKKINELIEINNIENPNIIKSGNKLRIKIKNRNVNYG